MDNGSPSRSSPLEEALDLPTLRRAWNHVRTSHGKAGADGVTLRRFAGLLDANLLALAEEVRSGTYHPGRVRQLRIRAGRKQRTITIVPVRDRVLQRAVLEVLEPQVDPRLLPSSFGYRPGRSLEDAVKRIVLLRERGLRWVVDADILSCFDSLDHELLWTFVDEMILDEDLRRLLRAWIATNPAAGVERRPRGIPLGTVISPLLCNIYLHHLDRSLRSRRYQSVRYADDFILLCRSKEHAARGLRATEKILRSLRLELNTQKTRVVSFDEGFDFLGVHFEGDAYRYVRQGKRITVSGPPPEFFAVGPAGYR